MDNTILSADACLLSIYLFAVDLLVTTAFEFEYNFMKRPSSLIKLIL